MEYERLLCPSDLPKPLKSMKVTLIWGNDGWCYMPELLMRQKFTETTYFFEKWSGIIAPPQFVEEVTWTLYSERPRVWREQGLQHDEFYRTKQSTLANTPSVPGKPKVPSQRQQQWVQLRRQLF